MKSLIDLDIPAMNEIRVACGTSAINESDLRRYHARGATILEWRISSELAGFCAFRNLAQRTHIDSLMVHPNWRVMGGGSRLLREAEGFAFAHTFIAHLRLADVDRSDVIEWLSARGYALNGANEMIKRNHREIATINRIKQYF